jgi:DNA-binding HxlR family transcriptional regulator
MTKVQVGKTTSAEPDGPPAYGQGCPVAVALDVVGRRWTLLILRDLAHAPLRFLDIAAINPGLSPNLLTSRLRSLEAAGIVSRRRLPPPERAVVYELTPGGRDAVMPILGALARFGGVVFESAPQPDSAEPMLAQMRRNGRWLLAKRRDVVGEFAFELDGQRVGLSIDEHRFEPSPDPPQQPTATIRSTSATMARLANGIVGLSEAEASGQLAIAGDRAAAVGLIDALGMVPLRP